METLKAIQTDPDRKVVEGNSVSFLEKDKVMRFKERVDGETVESKNYLSFREHCNVLRTEIRLLCERVQFLKIAATEKPLEDDEMDELRENVMLAYRHLEDARMRIGKVLQVWEGGVSIYDKAPDIDARTTTPDEGETQG